ncbi:MAG: YwbE family protein [Flavobacteriales bacterium]
MEELASPSVNVDHLDGRYRENIHLWQDVAIVTKRNQKTGILTYGKVRWILTSKAFHSRGIKVMLEDRQVGRVYKIMKPSERNE